VDDPLVNLVVSIGIAAVTAIVASRIWVYQQFREIQRDYDKDLRTRRLAAYEELWRKFEPLAVYAPSESITYERVRELGRDLRGWYFNIGGLLFTQRARDAYFLVQDAIDQIARLPGSDDIIRGASRHWTRDRITAADRHLRIPMLPSPTATDLEHQAWRDCLSRRIAIKWRFGERPDLDFVLLQFLASSLRTLLAQDLLTRDPSLLRRGRRFSRLRTFFDPLGSGPPPASPARP
jgi:hypothetical protein